MEMHASVGAHIERVNDEEAIECDGISPYWRCKGVVQQVYLVVVDIHIFKEIPEHLRQYISSMKHGGEPLCALPSCHRQFLRRMLSP